MSKFKIAVSKDQKKYTIILDSDNERLAREKVHKEWYSILSVEEVSDLEIVGNKFYFEAIKDGKLKKWKVVWEDIFKIYLKLRKDLQYDIKVLYSVLDEWINEYWKLKIISELEAEYDIYLKSNKEKKENKSKSSKFKKKKESFDNFYMKKDLDETYKLINFVLSKLQNIIENKKLYNIDLNDVEKLKQIYNSIIKLKKSTNISKIKEIWELALLKVWKIELSSIEKDKNEESRNLLWDTNKLLKKIWSKRQFIEKDRDIKYILLNFFSKIEKFFTDLKQEKSEDEKKENIVDKDSYSYLKTVVLLWKYKKRLNQNNWNLLKNFTNILFPFWKNRDLKDNILIRRKVIKQNISLLEAKKSWKVYSYTRIIKWYKKFIEQILIFFSYIRNFIFLLVFSYSLVFLMFLNSSYYSFIDFSFNYNWLFYFIVAMFAYFVITASRWIISLILNFSLLFFVTIFWIINF